MPRFLTCFLLLLAALVLLACSDEDGAGRPTPTAPPTPAATVAATPEPTATRAPTATATPEPAPSPTPTSGSIGGLFKEPRPAEPDETRTVPPRPESPFPPHDRMTVVLYDLETNEVLELGAGWSGVFSPDDRYLVWAAGERMDTLRVMTLATGDVTDLGAGTWPMEFLSDTELLVPNPGGRGADIVDIESGDRRAYEGGERRGYTVGGLTLAPRGTPDGWVIRESNGEDLLNFEATGALLLSSETLVLATPVGNGTSNIFIVDLARHEAEFVATAYVTAPGTLPLSANERYVLWTDNFCVNVEPRRAVLYDRESGELIAFDSAFYGRLRGDRAIIMGEFGHVGVMSVDGEWQAVLSEGTVDVFYSPSLRYATRGVQLGHGGVCPP